MPRTLVCNRRLLFSILRPKSTKPESLLLSPPLTHPRHEPTEIGGKDDRAKRNWESNVLNNRQAAKKSSDEGGDVREGRVMNKRRRSGQRQVLEAWTSEGDALGNENMMPVHFDENTVRWHGERAQTTFESWKQITRKCNEERLPKVDAYVDMVYPSFLSMRRTGRAESEDDKTTYRFLGEGQAATGLPAHRSLSTPLFVSQRLMYAWTPTSPLAIQIRQYSTPSKPSRPSSKPKKPPTTSPTLRSTTTPKSPTPTLPKPEPAPWQIQKNALRTKFNNTSWSPRRKLSPDAVLHIQTLHSSNPQLYTTPLLASSFKTSPEAIRRILKSKWLSNASPEKMQERRERWAKRHDRIWDMQAELGLRPKRDKERTVDDADTGGERVEEGLQAQEMLRRGREENPLWREMRRS